MIYSSPEFLILFLITLFAYLSFARNYQARFHVLLVASLVFYAWTSLLDSLVFLFVLLVSWLAAFFAVRFPHWRAPALYVGIFLMAAHLFFWKYAPWIVSMAGFGPLSLPLPVGISFFTLQGIAYLIDVLHEQAELITFRKFVLFKSFFAQLIAGPIVRAHQLLPQLDDLPPPRAAEFFAGMRLFLFGFVKKVVVADAMGALVSPVFESPTHYTRAALIQASLGYAVQIWGDFSGYTDMGRGAARMLGINLPENFLSPYFSRGPGEFWRRWHITLSQWIRDYLFVPLSLRAESRLGLLGVVFATMLIAGLWHGANWTFVIFGLYWGALLTAEAVFTRSQSWAAFAAFSGKSLPAWICHAGSLALTFVLVTIGWVIFRASNMSLLRGYFHGLRFDDGSLSFSGTGALFCGIVFCFAYQAVTFFSFEKQTAPIANWLETSFYRMSQRQPGGMSDVMAGLGMGASLALLGLIAIFFRFSDTDPKFIYFQF